MMWRMEWRVAGLIKVAAAAAAAVLALSGAISRGDAHQNLQPEPPHHFRSLTVEKVGRASKRRMRQKDTLRQLSPQFPLLSLASRLDSDPKQFPIVLTIAMVRVSTLDSTPKYSALQMQQHLFGSNPRGTTNTFVQQFAACSMGRFQFQPVNTTLMATISGGVIDVLVPQPIDDFHTNFMGLVLAAQVRLKEQLRLSASASLSSSLADKVLFCLPPGTGDWAASASLNHWRIQLNDEWCLSLSTLMHELGHSVGLRHAGLVQQVADTSSGTWYEDEYGDGVGYMGGSQLEIERPRKCYNAYNLYQLGWFYDRQVQWNPMEDGPALIPLVSIVDAEHLPPTPATTSNTTMMVVLLNLDNQLYLHYNVAEKFNAETTQPHANRVTISRPSIKGSVHLASLAAKESYAVDNFAGSGQTLRIEACEKTKSIVATSGSTAATTTVKVMLVSVTLVPSTDKGFKSAASAVESMCGRDPSPWPPPRVTVVPQSAPTASPSVLRSTTSLVPSVNSTKETDEDASSTRGLFSLLAWLWTLIFG